jgi:hypothetical protein
MDVLAATMARIAALAGALLLAAAAPPDGRAEVLAGPSTLGAGRSPTARSEESKLWWHDGAWWASLWDARTSSFHAFRLTPQGWSDTGTMLDPRARTRADVLADGDRLYVASHRYTARRDPADGSLLFRLTYDRAAGRYVRDPGFPVSITPFKPLSLVVGKDSTGRLWASWTEGGRVVVAATACTPACRDDRWLEPRVLPFAEARVAGEDVAALVRFDGHVGLMWSNQRLHAFFFASHRDGAPPGAWTLERPPPGVPADNHISLSASRDGRVVAAVKTTPASADSALTVLLVRDRGGRWIASPIGYVRDRHTRPVVVLDRRGSVEVFLTAPAGDDPARLTVYRKRTSLDSPVFKYGRGEPLLGGMDDLNDVTSTKQLVTPESGVLVVATDLERHRYVSHHERLPDAGPVADADPAGRTVAVAPRDGGGAAGGGGTSARWALLGAIVVVLATAAVLGVRRLR